MKRILIAIHTLSFDGAEKVAAMWANYLSKEGHQVAFLVHNRLEKEQKLDNRIAVLSIADTVEDYRALSVWQRLIVTRKTVKAFAPDIIISLLPRMQILVMLATLGIKCKRIETIRNNPWTDTDIGKKRALWNCCFFRSDRIIVQTEEQLEYFSRRERKKCVVIRNPILCEPEQKQYHKDFLQRFIALGRVNEQKNYQLMIRAFACAAKDKEDITLDIFGTGPIAHMEWIQSQINAAGLDGRVTLRGRTDKVSEELMSHDAFLMSSDYEGMPNALAEAMATGLVCLSTDCKTGPKDMIDSGVNGYLATTGSEESFEEGIRKIMQMDLAQCTAMGAAAREKILTMCSEENTLVRLNQLIEEM